MDKEPAKHKVFATKAEDYNKILLDLGKTNEAISRLGLMMKLLWESPEPFLEQLIAKSLTEEITDEKEITARATMHGLIRAAIKTRPAAVQALKEECPECDWDAIK